MEFTCISFDKELFFDYYIVCKPLNNWNYSFFLKMSSIFAYETHILLTAQLMLCGGLDFVFGMILKDLVNFSVSNEFSL